MVLTDQTFLQLITRLGHEMNDLVALTATSNGTVPTHTLHNHYHDWYTVFSSTAGIRQSWRMNAANRADALCLVCREPGSEDRATVGT